MNRRSTPIFMVLFLLSGASGLIYEVVWTRLFTVVIGNTVFSVSAILTVFMGGLALGSWLSGRLLDRKPIPLIRSYAVLEAGIGFYNLLLPLLLKVVDPLFRLLYSSTHESFLLLGFTRFIICFVLLILPTAMMGATLPILVRFYVTNIADVGRQAGRIYAVNTFGAALGAAAAGFLLVPYLGVTSAMGVAIALNFGIAAVAWQAGRRHELLSALERGQDQSAGPRIVLAAMFLSGFAALMDEVAWTRVLALVVGPTTYAFTLMLCAIITGLGLGAVAGSFLARRYEIRPATLAWVEIGIGIASLALLPAFGQLPLWIARVVTRYVSSFGAIQAVEFLIFFGLMLAPTILLGITFPLASKLYAKSNSLLGTEVSAIYAFNTAGGIAGSLVAGFILIPRIGSQHTLIAAAAVNVTVGAVLTVAAAYARREFRQLLPAAFALLAFLSIFFIPAWNPELMTSGGYKYAPFYASNSDLESMLTSGDLLYFKEGATTTVSTRKYRGNTMLSIDGKVDATDAGDMTTQKMLAHLPLLFAREARNVAIIGLGSGVTAGAALRHPIEKLDIVEISPEVVEASRLFLHVNHNPLADPRTELIIGDGRNHLRYTGRQYDVIISEPSNPWISGMASLFTQEFFREARSRLAPAGIHCQWFHSYNMSPDDFRTIIASFRKEFPHATLWNLNEYDFLLLGSEAPLALDESVLQRNFERVSEDLREIRIQDLYSIVSLLMLRDEELDRFAEGAALNTDDVPVLEFRAPRSVHADTTDRNFAALLAVPHRTGPMPMPTPENHRHKGEMLLAGEAFKDAMKEFQAAIAGDVNDARAWKGLAGTARGADRAELQQFFEDMLRNHPLNVIRFSAAEFYSQQGNYARTAALLDEVLQKEPKNIEALEKLADALADQGNARLPEITDRLIAAAPNSASGLFHLATIRLYQGRVDEAIQIAKRSLDADPKSARARNLLAVAYDRTHQPNLAQAEFQRAIELTPDDWVSYNNYGLFLLGRDRNPEAREQFRRAISLNPENVQGFVGVGEALRQMGNMREAESWYRKALRLDPNQPVAKQFVK